MLKQTVQYQDFNEKNVTEVLYFNLTKSDLLDHLDLTDEAERFRASIEGEERDLTQAEMTMLLELVKRLVRISYGRRSDDGSKFNKSDAVWEDFKSSMAYDTLFMSLFENEDKVVSFITGIMPKDLLDQTAEARAELAAPTAPAPSVLRPVEDVKLPAVEPTDEQLLAMDPTDMTQSQLLRAFQLKSTK